MLLIYEQKVCDTLTPTCLEVKSWPKILLMYY